MPLKFNTSIKEFLSCQKPSKKTKKRNQVGRIKGIHWDHQAKQEKAKGSYDTQSPVIYSYFEKGCRKKCARDNPER